MNTLQIIGIVFLIVLIVALIVTFFILSLTKYVHKDEVIVYTNSLNEYGVLKKKGFNFISPFNFMFVKRVPTTVQTITGTIYTYLISIKYKIVDYIKYSLVKESITEYLKEKNKASIYTEEQLHSLIESLIDIYGIEILECKYVEKK